jgi:hypothetical protein
MMQHADRHDGLDALMRANRALLLGALWGALALCVVGSVVYDIGRWVQAW